MHKNVKNILKSSEPSLVGIHMKALIEYYQMSTHVPGFQSFPALCHHLMLTKLAASSIRVKTRLPNANFSQIFIRIFLINIALSEQIFLKIYTRV